jgi:predicted glycosyltransferase
VVAEVLLVPKNQEAQEQVLRIQQAVAQELQVKAIQAVHHTIMVVTTMVAEAVAEQVKQERVILAHLDLDHHHHKADILVEMA